MLLLAAELGLDVVSALSVHTFAGFSGEHRSSNHEHDLEEMHLDLRSWALTAEEEANASSWALAVEIETIAEK